MSDYEVVDLGGEPVEVVALEGGGTEVVTPVVAGPRGAKGDTGATGDPGEDGTSITAGTGAPVGTGQPGDLYLDAVTGNLYQYS